MRRRSRPAGANSKRWFAIPASMRPPRSSSSRARLTELENHHLPRHVIPPPVAPGRCGRTGRPSRDSSTNHRFTDEPPPSWPGHPPLRPSPRRVKRRCDPPPSRPQRKQPRQGKNWRSFSSDRCKPTSPWLQTEPSSSDLREALLSQFAAIAAVPTFGNYLEGLRIKLLSRQSQKTCPISLLLNLSG